jgi:hypothetical protein
VHGVGKRRERCKLAEDLLSKGYFKEAVPDLKKRNKFSQNKLYKFGNKYYPDGPYGSHNESIITYR